MTGTANTVNSKTVVLPIELPHGHVVYSDGFIKGSLNPQNITVAVVDAGNSNEIYRLWSATTTEKDALGIKAFWIGY